MKSLAIIAPTYRRPGCARAGLPAGGWTLVELLVAMGIIVLLMTVFLIVAGTVKEKARRLQCASNLRQIGLALLTYETEYKEFPRVTQSHAGLSPGRPLPTQSLGSAAFSDPFRSSIVNDVAAALFLLLRTQKGLPSALFICPSTERTADDFGGEGRRAADRSSFTSVWNNLGYSYANPYRDVLSAAQKVKGTRVRGDTVLAADKNPGCCGTGWALLDNDFAGDPGRRGNSNNHREDGQNVLFGDGHVAFEKTAAVGPGGDNIYSSKWGPVPLMLSPKDGRDAILLPTDDELNVPE